MECMPTRLQYTILYYSLHCVLYLTKPIQWIYTTAIHLQFHVSVIIGIALTSYNNGIKLYKKVFVVILWTALLTLHKLWERSYSNNNKNNKIGISHKRMIQISNYLITVCSVQQFFNHSLSPIYCQVHFICVVNFFVCYLQIVVYALYVRKIRKKKFFFNNVDNRLNPSPIRFFYLNYLR